jgi:hypothetical protein
MRCSRSSSPALARGGRSLEEIMREMSRKAQERGLTPEILGEILHGEG